MLQRAWQVPGDPMQVRDARAAIAKLHGATVAASVGAKKKKKKKAEGEGVARLWARQVKGEGEHVKKWRLILRNLAFDVIYISNLCFRALLELMHVMNFSAVALTCMNMNLAPACALPT